MPEEILRTVDAEFARIKHLIRDYDKRVKTKFVVSPINENGFCWGNTGSGREGIMFAMIKLRNRPITSEEWGIVFDFMTELNGKGFSYDDIYNNLFFRRDADEKLVISLIDFENENYSDNLRDLQRLGNIFNSIGVKEKNFYYDNIFSAEDITDFPSF